MPKYECRTCENNFVQAATANRLCPACGSNNIFEVWDEPKQQGPIHENMGIIISCIVVVLMLVILFVLPYAPHRYLASIQAVPENCGFSISLTEYGYPIDTTTFRFSIDNEKNWKESPRFTAKVAGSFEVKVKETDNEKDTIYYAFVNPYTFQPASSCMPIPPDTCDCKNLSITGVEKMKISNKDAIVVHVSQPNCGIEYSISGVNGKYQQDSVFKKFALKDSVFVKNTKCQTPVAYSGNPFIATPVVVINNKPQSNTSTKRYLETDSKVYPKPYPSLHDSRAELEEFLSKEIQKEMGSHGAIEIAFTVETMGNLTNFKNINNVSQALNECTRRIISKLGWNPGYVGNNPVDTYVTLRIPPN
jgi:hypothetical protein